MCMIVDNIKLEFLVVLKSFRVLILPLFYRYWLWTFVGLRWVTLLCTLFHMVTLFYLHRVFDGKKKLLLHCGYQKSMKKKKKSSKEIEADGM